MYKRSSINYTLYKELISAPQLNKTLTKEEYPFMHAKCISGISSFSHSPLLLIKYNYNKIIIII